MKRVVLATISLAAVSLSTPAAAYVGPGAGLSLLGALWALVAALFTAIAFVIAWPLRKAFRRRRSAPSAESTVPARSEATDTEPAPGTRRG